MAGQGGVRSGRVWRGRLGKAGPGMAVQGKAGLARLGEAGRGAALQGRLGGERLGGARCGLVVLGKAWQARRGKAWQGSAGLGEAWFFNTGSIMDDIRITIPAVPVAQPRPRAVTVAGRSMIVGNPKRHPVTAYKATCRMAAAEAYSGPPIDGPLAVSLLFVLPRPSAKRWKSRPMPREPHHRKPDFDNLAKATIDALNGLLWHDDAQLYEVRIVKTIAAGDEQPHVEMTVWRP